MGGSGRCPAAKLFEEENNMKYEWLDQYLLDKPGTEKDFKIEWGWHR